MRPWTIQFVVYLDTVNLSDTQENMLIIQRLEGSSLTFIEAIADENTTRESIEKFLMYVRPSQASIMRKMLYLKQLPKETIYLFVIKFKNATIGSDVKEKRLREAFVEALTAAWRQQARAILASNPTIDGAELIHKLT